MSLILKSLRVFSSRTGGGRKLTGTWLTWFICEMAVETDMVGVVMVDQRKLGERLWKKTVKHVD